MSLALTLDRRRMLLASSAAVLLGSALHGIAKAADPTDWKKLTEADWKRRLSPAAFEILRHQDTESPGTSPLLNEHRRGVFSCIACRLPLFRSEWKFESGTGWPSFYTTIDGSLLRRTDNTLGMARTEYHCARCLGHQGHVFDDGPKPTGLRYCNNGAVLTFTPA
jgi:peptide-methionine (R)-S-oxide reductase